MAGTPDNATVHADGSRLGHVWERARLGRAPFRFVGMTERVLRHPDGTLQPSGCCDYCGTGIRYCFRIRSADGQEFEVGSDCVDRLGDERLVAVVMSEERRRRNNAARERRRVKRQAEEVERAAERDARMPEYRDALAALESRPHPHAYYAAQGKTLADYFRYFERDGKPDHRKQREAIKAAADAAE